MKRIFIIILLAICFSQCTDENEITSRSYPRVRTLAIENITAEGATFQGEVTYSNTDIIDYGFVWTTSDNLSIETSDIISLGPKPGTGTFDAFVDRGLKKDVKHYVRAYARSANHIVYGEVQAFKSQGSKPPQLVSFSPTQAHWGDTVIIRGHRFTKSTDQFVKFGDATAIVLSANDSLVKVLVPDDLLVPEANISLFFYGINIVSEETFQVLAPEIDRVEPTHAAANATVYIYGEGFNKWHSQVYFGGTPASIFIRTNEYIRCTVPTGLPKGPITLTIKSGDESLDTQTNFTID